MTDRNPSSCCAHLANTGLLSHKAEAGIFAHTGLFLGTVALYFEHLSVSDTCAIWVLVSYWDLEFMPTSFCFPCPCSPRFWRLSLGL